MNLRRGLLRLWIVCSVAWIVAIGYDTYTLSLPPLPPGFKYGAAPYPGVADRPPALVAKVVPVRTCVT